MKWPTMVGGLLAAAGTALIILSLFYNSPDPGDQFYNELHSSPNLVIAKVNSVTGNWNAHIGNRSQPAEIKLNTEIKHGDTVSNNGKGEIKINIPSSGAQFAVSSVARFQMELWNVNNSSSPVFLHLEHGDLKVLKPGSRGGVFLIEDGTVKTFKNTRQASLKTINPLKVGKSIALKLSEPSLDTPSGKKTSKKKKAPSVDERLDKAMQKMSSGFARCQANRIQDVGPLSGQMMVGIQVAPEGTVREIKIIKNDIDDSQLLSCVKSALARIKISPFKGKPVYRSYPIEFE